MIQHFCEKANIMIKTKSSLVVYQSKNGALELKTDSQYNTIWLTQEQLASLFDVQRQAISKHLGNIFSSGELNENSVCSKMEHTAKDGKTYKVNHYNLDAALSVGYRVNSKSATHFRQWATKTLRNHIVEGYTINRDRIKENYEQFMKAIADVKSLLPSASPVDNVSILELISLFADTWISLDAYDRDQLSITGITKKKVSLTSDKLDKALQKLKYALVQKGEATELFGAERTKNSIEGIVGNVMQSVGDQDVYPSIEEKAAHLLYFIVKNHPFLDGNKRSGAYAFIWFLQQAKVLDRSRITPPALTALTLLIAQSDAKDKNKMVALVCTTLSKK
ncbi:MAG: virulence protein RhuM/Fic/DOC family protein [Alphaproteobacteria bacterium]